MAQAAQPYDNDPQQYPRLSSDEQRIADAVIAALRSELQPMRDTLEQHTELLANIQPILDTQEQHTKLLANIQPILDTQEQHTKILEDIQQELRGVNRILADAGLILDDPDL